MTAPVLSRLEHRALEAAGLGTIRDKVVAGERLSREDGLALYQGADLLAIGALANRVREARHGDAAYFIVNQHINHTNVCIAGCKFCAFYRTAKQKDAYTLTPEDVERRMRQHLDEPIREIHMVGGVNPALPLQYYVDVIRAMKRVRPDVHVKAFTMVEIAAMAETFEKPVEEILLTLKEAGLGSLPGGGAEILTDHAHQVLFKGKIDHRAWMEVAKTAHRVGLKSNATMLYGHVETLEERVDHLLALREAQDETDGFMAFIPLAFHPENTRLSHIPKPSAADDLRQLAVGRLMLDNFPHIKAYWIMMTPRVAQAGLHFGADDLDGTVVTEEIFHRAGAVSPQLVARQRLVDLIEEAGRVPVERDTLYRPVAAADPVAAASRAAGPASPVPPAVRVPAPASEAGLAH
ncbi:MAG TPA: aminofutalosine synthase MqnE [Candidatus Polarisedimenticolia bacterium]|nr:aminofutalosine synthase MqnE [Candidatus Polarisedimenticolia bacterium]